MVESQEDPDMSDSVSGCTETPHRPRRGRGRSPGPGDLFQDRTTPHPRCRGGMARPRAAAAAAPRDTRTARSGLRRTADPASQVGAHRRTRRSAGAQLRSRRLPDGVHRIRLRRPGRRPRGTARGRSRSRRHRPGSLAPAAPIPARAALRRPGAVPRPHGPGRPRHDVHLGLRAGVPRRRLRGAGPARARTALVARAPARRGPRGRLRQLPARRGQPHRLAFHPAGAVDGDRRRESGAPSRWTPSRGRPGPGMCSTPR